MADRKWLVFGLLCLLAIFCFFLANKLWFYPKYTAQVTLPPQYTSPDDIPEVVVIKPFEGTLKKIVQQKSFEGGKTAAVENGRNPFLWHGELKPEIPKPPPLPDKDEQPVEIPRLGMIITGSSGKSVMLNDILVRQGDTYGGHIVENIDSESVILSGDYGVLQISMLAKSFGEPRVDILEVKNPNLLIKPVVTKKK